MIGQSQEEGCQVRPLAVSHSPEMIPAARRARIVEALEAQRAVKVATLSEALGVSEITIRRDLMSLEREGLLARTYGGALLRKRPTDDPGHEGPEGKQAVQKARIAKAAAAMIEPRDTVFLGSDMTVAHICAMSTHSSRHASSPTVWGPPRRPRACASRRSSWAVSTALR